ncbi:MAG: hypothetical protein ACPG31_05405 [Planctomycetota bacterium]
MNNLFTICAVLACCLLPACQSSEAFEYPNYQPGHAYLQSYDVRSIQYPTEEDPWWNSDALVSSASLEEGRPAVQSFRQTDGGPPYLKQELVALVKQGVALDWDSEAITIMSHKGNLFIRATTEDHAKLFAFIQELWAMDSHWCQTERASWQTGL